MHRLHEPVEAVLREHLAQPPDVHVHGALLDVDVAAPDPVDELAAGEHALGMAHEEVQQAELGRPGAYGLAPGGDTVARGVQPQAADLDRVVVAGRRGPLQHRPDPRRQLLHGEGFDDVVVGAGVEPAQTVALLALRGKHDHRDVPCGIAPAELAYEVEAAHAGQHPVEQDEVGPLLLDRTLGLRGVGHGARLEAGPRQRELHHLPDGGFVLDEENVLAHRPAPSPAPAAGGHSIARS